MRKLILILSALFILSMVNAQQTRFWVNGSGYWNDPMHWSTQSGGPAGASIPNEETHVVFDYNSLSSGDVVNIRETARCKNLNVITPNLTLKGKSAIHVSGSVVMHENSKLNKFKGDLIFNSSSQNSINIPVLLKSNLVFNGSGGWNFQSNIHTRKDISLNQGVINTQGNAISCSVFSCAGDKDKNLNISGSELWVDQWFVENEQSISIETAKSLIRIKDVEKDFKGGNFSYTITKPGAKAISSITATPTDALCFIGTDPGDGSLEEGSINVKVDPVANYYITLISQSSGSEVGRDFGNNLDFTLDQGTYTVRASETGYNQNYTSATNIVVGSPDELKVAISVATDITCPDDDDLQLTATGSDGSGVYTDYDWVNALGTYSYSGQTTDADLGLGNYIVTVIDNNGCQASDNFYYYPVDHPNNEYFEADGRPVEMTFDTFEVTKTCGAGATGSIKIIGVDKGSPSLIVWPTTGYGYAARLTSDPAPSVIGDFQDGNTVASLAAGTYNIFVMDGNQCIQQYSGTVEVTAKDAPSADAGGPSSSCEGQNFTVSDADAQNGTILWTVQTGTGSIQAGTENTENAVYVPGAGETGGVELLLTVMGTEGCAGVNDSDTHDLTINANPTPFAGADNDACGSTYTISDAALNPASGTATWTQLDGQADGTISFVPSENAVQPQVNVSGSTVARFRTYQLQMEQTVNGCSTSDVVEVTFVQDPGADAGSNKTICEGDTYDLDGTATAASSIVWSNQTTGDDTGFSDTGVEDPTYTPTAADIAAGTVTLQMRVNGNAPCTFATATMNLTIQPVPTADAGADSAFCGEVADLNGVQSIGGSSANWVLVSAPAGGTVFISNSAAFSTTATLTGAKVYGTYEFQLTETAGSCADNDNVLITYDSLPDGSAGDAATICEGESHIILNASARNYSALLWTEDGNGALTGGTETTLFPEYNAAEPDINPVTLTLTISGSGACNNPINDVVKTVELVVNSNPNPVVTGDFDVCVAEVVTYNTTAGMSNYDWTITNGSITDGGDGNNYVEVTWPGSAGAGNVQVAYSDGNSCSGTSNNYPVTINALPTVSITPDPAEICQNETITLDGNPAGGSGVYVSHQWTTNVIGSIDNLTAATPDFTGIQAGSTTVTYVVTDNYGCKSDPDVLIITVENEPVAIAGGPGETCQGQNHVVTGASAAYGDILWTIESGLGSILAGTQTTETPTYVPDASETGAVQLRMTVNGTGACAAKDSVDYYDLTVHATPVPNINGDNEACKNETKSYTTDAGMSDYDWTVSGGTIVGGGDGNDNVDVQWTGAAGTLSVDYTDGNSCSGSSAVFNVTIHDLPTAAISPDPAEVCEGGTLNMNGNPAGGSGTYITHAWSESANGSLDDLGVVDPTFTGLAEGTVTLTYSVTDDNGCSIATPASIDVTVNASPTPNAGPDTTICYEGTYQLNGSIDGVYDSFQWVSSGDGTFDDDEILNAVYTPGSADLANGTLDITLQVTSALCGMVTDVMTLNIYPEMLASVGGVSPFTIDVTSTEINVAIWAEHNDISQLSFYLVNPDGDKKIKLYDYTFPDDGCNPWDIWTTEIDSLVFSLNSAGGLGAFNLCDFAGSADPITGEYDPEDSWNIINGEDPAKGGWSIRIEDNAGGGEGTLTRARITFRDIDGGTGQPRTITYDSGDITNDINDNSSTTYVVPIGLRTNCYGSCDAHAIVSVQNGSGNYLYDWDDPEVNDAADVLLCGGDFTVTVTDVDRGCTSVATVSVLEPDPILLAMDSTNVVCYGDSAGAVSVVASNGLVPYEYIWNDGDSTESNAVNNLPAGTYTVTVSDQNFCQAIDSVIVGQPAQPITVTNILEDSTDCTVNNGTITLTVVGGTPDTDSDPYTFALDGVPSVHPITGLGVGSYVITVQDSTLCSLDTTITMVDKGNIEISAFTMDQEVSCNGNCDGIARVNFTGGSGDFTYNWSDGSNPLAGNQTLENVCGDSTYYITITDNTNGCSSSFFDAIPQPDSVIITIDGFTDVLCSGDSSGTATAAATGGDGVYTFFWIAKDSGDTISTVQNPMNLPAGWIYAKVEDGNQCSHSIDSVRISQPVALSSTMDSTLSDCGMSNGTAIVTPSGGTPFTGDHPYTYLWSNVPPATDSVASGLAAGLYTVTIQDNNGCTLTDSVTIVDDTDLLVAVDSVHDVLCNGDANGEAFITVSGGTPDYIYSWTNGEVTEDAVALTAGANFVTVTDQNSCKQVLQVDILQPDSLKINTQIIDSIFCNGVTGRAKAIAIGGVLDYNYLWDNGETDTIAAALYGGTHYVTVTDANGCYTLDSVVMTQPEQISFDFDMTRTECGDSLGILKVIDTLGGFGDYTVSWASLGWNSYPAADSINYDSITHLPVANYVAIVTDAKGCTVRDSINMLDNAAMTIRVDSLEMVSCNGGNNGLIMAFGENATSPYAYIWKNYAGDTIDQDTLAENLFAGSYYLQVTDIESCRRDTAFTITEPDTLSNQFVFTENFGCAGEFETVSFYAAVSGGTKPYAYFWQDQSGSPIIADSLLQDVTMGWYYLNVIDANNCAYEDSILIQQPEIITFEYDTVKTECADSTGSFEVTVSGGVAPYTYYWYPMNNPNFELENNDSSYVEGLWVDAFVLEVTDALGCTIADTVTMEDVSEVDFDYDIVKLPTCATIPNGSASIFNIVNELRPIEFLWDSGETDSLATSLYAGVNTIRVTDANGCAKVQVFEMPADSVLNFDISYRHNTFDEDHCIGYVGIIEENISGGVGNYSYQWSNAAGDDLGNESELFNRCADTYYVTVSDELNPDACEVVDSVEILLDTLRLDTAMVENVICYGDSTGRVQIQATGGIPSYEYQWSYRGWDSYPEPDSTGSTITNLAAGWYIYTITDNNPYVEKIVIDSIQVTQNPDILVDFTIDSSDCDAPTGGIIIDTLYKPEEAHPFTFAWSNDSTTISMSNIWWGNYSVTITDTNGCNYVRDVIIPDNSAFDINPYVQSPIACFGGEAILDVRPNDQGNEPYDYAWSNNDTEGPINTVEAGYYGLTVTDALGCERYWADSVKQPDQISFGVQVLDTIECYYGGTGSIKVVDTLGGNGGYSFRLLEDEDEIVPTQDNPEFVNIGVGQYTIRVIDKNLCSNDLFYEFASKQPQPYATFEILDTSACNFEDLYAGTGSLKIQIEARYFDQVSSTDFTSISYVWENGDNTEESYFVPAGETYVDVSTTTSDDSVCTTRIFYDMPYKDSVFVDPVLSNIQNTGTYEDFFCMGDTVELYGVGMYSYYDSVVWETDDMNTILSETNNTNVNILNTEDAYYKFTVWKNNCRDTSGLLFVGRYQVDSLRARAVGLSENVIPAGQEIRLNANKPTVTYSGMVYFDTTHVYHWISDDQNASWTPKLDTLSPYVVLSQTANLILTDSIKIAYEELFGYSDMVCVLHDTLAIEVLPDFTPPSGFTPNGDGINDRWVLDIQEDENTIVQVYNRWGGLVWERKGIYQADEWDGTNLKGKDLPSGTYYYRIVYDAGDNDYIERTGPITILR